MRNSRRALVPAEDKVKLINLLPGAQPSQEQLEAGGIIADDLSRALQAGAGKDEIYERAVVLARGAQALNARIALRAVKKIRAA